MKKLDLKIFCNDCGRDFGISHRHKAMILEEYKQAVWNFVLDHSRDNNKGNIYCAFNLKDRSNLEGRIWARKNGYERPDFKRIIHEEVKEKNNAINFEKVKKHQKAYLRKLAGKSIVLKLIFKIYKLI